METMTHWLQAHLLPCPIRALTGIECPGCGVQRAGLALLRGDFAESWSLYPPLVPFLVMLVTLVVAMRTRLRYRMHVLAASVAVTGVFVVVNYALKFS